MGDQIGLCHECYRWRVAQGLSGGEQDKDTGMLTKASEDENREYDNGEEPTPESYETAQARLEERETFEEALADTLDSMPLDELAWLVGDSDTTGQNDRFDDGEGQAAEGPQKSADDDRAKLTIHKQPADDVTKRMIPPYGWVSMVVEDGNDYSPKSEQLEDAEALQTPRECSRETVECAEEPAQDGDSPRSTHVASCECQFCCPYLHDRLPRKYEATERRTARNS